MNHEYFQDESKMTAEDRKRETLVVQFVLGVILMLAVFFYLGVYLGTKETTARFNRQMAEQNR